MNFKIVPILLLALLLTSCGKGVDIDSAKLSVKDFHLLLNNNKFKEIYSGSSRELKDYDKEDTLSTNLQAVITNLGKHKESKVTAWKVSTALSGQAVILTYDSVFEKGAALEQFTFKIEDGKTKLLNYNIKSKASR